MKKSIFDQYPNLEEYFETSDGQKFFKETAAKTHARTLEDKSVNKVKRTDAKKPQSSADILALVSSMDLETAQKYLEQEKGLETPRTTILKALEGKINKLQNAK